MLCLGTLDGCTKVQRDELADMLTSMIEHGQYFSSDNKQLYEKAYWLVSVTKYRLKIKEYPNVRLDEIMRIASTHVVVTAQM